MECEMCGKWFSSSNENQRRCAACDRIKQNGKTNADRIRAMSDEELAELLRTADWCEGCGQTKQDGTCAAMELDGPLCKYCVAAGLKWLSQPAEED